MTEIKKKVEDVVENIEDKIEPNDITNSLVRKVSQELSQKGCPASEEVIDHCSVCFRSILGQKIIDEL